MRRVQRSALVPYSAVEIFSLVDDIASYPEFLPWCKEAVVHSRRENVVDATLEMQRGGIRKSFRTLNTSAGVEQINMQLVEGPFRHLSGCWTFNQLGESGSKVVLDLEFEFANTLLDLLFGPFFEDISNTLVDAFTQRAHDVFGN